MRAKVVSMSARSKRYPLIPEGEQKCVWMTSGFISYRLCDRNYQCDLCPFDQAIKNEEIQDEDVKEAADGRAEGSPNVGPSAQIHGAIFYHPDHCWVKVENAERVRIGVDDLLTQLIARVKVVILPQAGSFICQGECFAHIIREDYILPVISPIYGSICAVNPRLEKEPELITDDPRGEGWLITAKPKNLESDIKALLFGRKALSWYRREERELVARIDLILKQDSQDLGPTMQDGGVRVSSLRDLLHIASAEQRTQILDYSVAGRSKKGKRGLN